MRLHFLEERNVTTILVINKYGFNYFKTANHYAFLRLEEGHENFK